MSSVYIIRAGDTFESIARKKLGSELRTDELEQANSGVRGPLAAGVALIIPGLLGTPIKQGDIGKDEVRVTIDGVRLKFWQGMRIQRSIDSISTAEFSAPMDAGSAHFRETFQPLSFKKLSIDVGGEPLLAGRMVAVTPALDSGSKTIVVGCYGEPAVLNDCTLPSAPREFEGQSLRSIVDQIVRIFGLSAEIRGNAGAAFESVAIEANTRVFSFLTTLAKQRGLLLTDNARGELLIHKPEASGASVARLEQGLSPLLFVSPTFNPQDYYSQVTGLRSSIWGDAGTVYTVKNSRLRGVIRPFSFEIPDAEGGDIQQVVEEKMGRMLANAVSYSVGVSTWRDAEGNIWEPGAFVDLLAPDAFVYKSYQFMIRSVAYEADKSTGRKATLDLVLPGAFSGVQPESMPWHE